METTTVKATPQEPVSDNPTLPFSNGFLKPRATHAPHAPPNKEGFTPHAPHAPPSPGMYRECQKNHAAAMGGHAVDGCGEFMQSENSLLCSACGCHRNFHRKYPDSPHALPHAPTPTQMIEYRPHHRHRPSPPRSASPPPISSAYYPSASQMLLSLSSPNPNHHANPNASGNARRRFRTKFTKKQKEKMYELAEKLTWKMQRRDEDVINNVCKEIGVEKGVFKVWMHNNKNTIGKKESMAVNGNGNGNGINLDNEMKNYSVNRHENGDSDDVSVHPVCTNGSSSCS